MAKLSNQQMYALNAICPYFTMFPLEFPLKHISKVAKDAVVLDPFCGRGTTNYAARISGVNSYGIDVSSVAVAIAKAKLADATVEGVETLAEELVASFPNPCIPKGEFWDFAYHHKTLKQICALREGLLLLDNDDAHILRAVCMGAMHGPRAKDIDSSGYFSNQMPRTYASKPAYSVRYWKERKLLPVEIDVIKVIKRKAERALKYYWGANCNSSNIINGGSELELSYQDIPNDISLVITSPPYYGMRTYVEDQWLRNWFIGGGEEIAYSGNQQICHQSHEEFALSLAAVWRNLSKVCVDGAKMVVRFGSIPSKPCDVKKLFKRSVELSESPWRIKTIVDIGNATAGKRQAVQMRTNSEAGQEYDFHLQLV